MERELVDLFEAAKKAADLASTDAVSSNGPEVSRCVDALKQLKAFPVTYDILVSTQVSSVSSSPKLIYILLSFNTDEAIIACLDLNLSLSYIFILVLWLQIRSTTNSLFEIFLCFGWLKN